MATDRQGLGDPWRRVAGAPAGLLSGKIGKRGARKNLFQTVLGQFKKPAKDAVVPLVAVRHVTQAPLKGNSTVDRFDDLKDGNLPRRARKDEAATGTPLRAQQPDLGEVLEDLGEEALGNAFVPADRIDHDGGAGGLPGQMEEPEDSVFACARDLHADFDESDKKRPIALLGSIPCPAVKSGVVGGVGERGIDLAAPAPGWGGAGTVAGDPPFSPVLVVKAGSIGIFRLPLR